MKIIKTIAELRQWRSGVHSVALVPTMGNLHDGHLALVREAKKQAQYVVVSIFVNPIQFGQGEDFDAYPRTLEEDAQKLAQEEVDVIFAPTVNELYPHVTQHYNVDPPHLQNELCGQFRPGHFRGVTTVVAKLFNIVQPDSACFGKKDFQQLTILKGMVADLNFNIHIIPVDTGRNTDGLALSSRNAYLTSEQRKQAPDLYQALIYIANKIQSGSRDYVNLEQQASHELTQKGWNVDYIEIRQADTLDIAKLGDKHLVVLVAARLGKTRLIDNIEITLL